MSTLSRSPRIAISLFLPSVLGALLLGAVATPAIAQTNDRENAFAAKLEGAKLIGKFTLSSAQGESAAQADNYSVSELERAGDNTWIFHYTMSYGKGPDGPKVTVPIPVKVEWAGDTPVLTMTKQTVEGLGTFSVRVMIYQDLYAGTWDNGTLGGHMWGRVVQQKDLEANNQASSGDG